MKPTTIPTHLIAIEDYFIFNSKLLTKSKKYEIKYHDNNYFIVRDDYRNDFTFDWNELKEYFKIQKQGGKRPNSGRKKLQFNKIPITIYVQEDHVEHIGGKEELKNFLNSKISQKMQQIYNEIN